MAKPARPSRSFPGHLLGWSGVSAFGAAWIIAGAFSPWSQIGGGLLTPSTCTFGSAIFGPASVVFAFVIFLAVLLRHAEVAAAAALVAIVPIGLGVLEVWGCADCVCTPWTGYHGPAYGWAMALAGALVASAGGVGWMLTARRHPEKEWFEP